MGNPTGFKKHDRVEMPKTPVDERVRHFGEFERAGAPEELRNQAARCMECGVPFCHWGCPLGNLIPNWNDLVYRGRYQEAAEALHRTNTFPEITGRVCPALCEASCVLGVNLSPVSIRQLEYFIADQALQNNWIVGRPPMYRTERRVAIVGSGPAGLSAAMELNHLGHTVTVFERSDRLGGLLRYGIPDFKLDKGILDRRIDQMEQEGVRFETSCQVGRDLPAETLHKEFHAVLLAGGSQRARDLTIPGRRLKGIHLAMEYLVQQNRRTAGDAIEESEVILAAGKRVVVLGGGDTGSDCVGTAIRQGAASVTQLEILPKPPDQRTPDNPWPLWPNILRTSSSHQEGCQRNWSVHTKAFMGLGERVEKLRCNQVEWKKNDYGKFIMRDLPGTEFEVEADLVLLALGFVGSDSGLARKLDLDTDANGRIITNKQMATTRPGVFAGGDLRRGQSLVVWAISEGRQAALGIDAYLNSLEN